MRSAALLLVCAACSSPPSHPAALDSIGGTPLQPGGGPSNPPSTSVDGGSLTVLSSGQGTPRGVVAVGAFVYFTTPAGVLSVPKTGGNTTTRVASSDPPSAIVASSTTACYTTDGGTVACFALSGGDPTTLALGVSGVSALALSNDVAYWASPQGGFSLERATTVGTGRSVLASAIGPFSPSGLAVAGSLLYVTTSGSGASVYQVSTTGGVAESLAPGAQAFTVDAILDSGRVLFGKQQDGASEILSVPTVGGATTSLASGLTSVGHLARDAAHLYWTSPTEGSVYALALTSGATPVLVASGLSAPNGLAVDDAVYVAVTDGIVRTPLAP